MRKRIWALAIGVMLAVIFTSFGTARARQVMDGNAAHDRFRAALAHAERQLALARTDGLFPNELAPYGRRLAREALAAPPASTPLWDTATASFYDRQAQSLRALALSIRSRVTRVTAISQADASAQLKNLQSDITTARSLDLDTTSAAAALARAQAGFASAGTARGYRAVSKEARMARASLQGPTAARKSYVEGVLAKAGNTLQGVLALADAERQNAEQHFALLGLLTNRVTGYEADLTRRSAAIHAQTTAFAAAVKEAPLHDEVQTILTDYANTVPDKMIVVSTENQHADVYQNSQIVYSTDVTTGGPELPTDHGVFHIYDKESPFVFHSPWPPGSPFYYDPTPVQYWMPFDGGEGLHDASWRSNFGPGSDLAPTDLGNGNTILGTHGCVNLPLDAAQFIWNWAPIGTTVVVI